MDAVLIKGALPDRLEGPIIVPSLDCLTGTTGQHQQT
jgi:hypothetical protein